MNRCTIDDSRIEYDQKIALPVNHGRSTLQMSTISKLPELHTVAYGIRPLDVIDHVQVASAFDVTVFHP